MLKPTENARPIVVILGAGASRAACPDGDRDGRVVPLMKDLVDVVGLRPILERSGVSLDGDFEKVYSQITEEGHSAVAQDIEEKIEEYFGSLVLPDHPTLYDHLLLSLRPKDSIITFNWDPFLLQAMQRTSRIARPTQRVYFLHGNVAIGVCRRHEPFAIGLRTRNCPRCGAALKPFPLLYPIRNKNYTDDPILKKLWRCAQADLSEASLMLVFGYSAPTSDSEAIELLKSPWRQASKRTLADTEIIDVRDESDLAEAWKPFLHNSHYQIMKDFFSSQLATYPRRTHEAMIESQLNIEFVPSTAIPSNASWSKLEEYYDPLLQSETSLDNWLASTE